MFAQEGLKTFFILDLPFSALHHELEHCSFCQKKFYKLHSRISIRRADGNKESCNKQVLSYQKKLYNHTYLNKKNFLFHI